MKLAANILLLFFLGSMFVSLFHMSHMDMSAGMSDCPFMSHEAVICPMNLVDHLGAWKSVFSSVTQTAPLLLTWVGLALLVISVAPNLLRKIQHGTPSLLNWLKVRTYTFSYRPLQELFSNGILHPKLY